MSLSVKVMAYVKYLISKQYSKPLWTTLRYIMQKAFKSLRARVNLHITQGHTDRGWKKRFQPRLLLFCAVDLFREWKKETKEVKYCRPGWDCWRLVVNMSQQSDNLQSSSASRQFLKVTATSACLFTPDSFLHFLPSVCLKHFGLLWKSVFEAAVTLTSPSTMTHMLEGSCTQDGTGSVTRAYFPSGECHDTCVCVWRPLSSMDGWEMWTFTKKHSILRSSSAQSQQWFTGQWSHELSKVYNLTTNSKVLWTIVLVMLAFVLYCICNKCIIVLCIKIVFGLETWQSLMLFLRGY